MGFLDVLKLIFAPALIAGAIYILLAYAILPLYRNHYARYSSYIPVNTLSSHTSGLRTRIADAISRFFLPAHMRWRREVVDRHESGDDLYFGEEEGESMVGFDVNRRDRSVRGGRVEVNSDRRLSRDLEGGFMDSDEEEGEGPSGDDRRR